MSAMHSDLHINLSKAIVAERIARRRPVERTTRRRPRLRFRPA